MTVRRGKGELLRRGLEVVFHLAAASRGIGARELARRTGVSLRTAYRDIDAIEDAGVPVISDGPRYSIMAGWSWVSIVRSGGRPRRRAA